MKNFLKNKQNGSLLVDASCSFPVFIMALCLIVCLLIHVEQEENTVYTQARKALMSESSLSAGACQTDVFLYEKENVPFSGVFTGLLKENYGSTKVLRYRLFSGSSSGIDSDGGIVYIFPKRGERYHRAGCTCLKDGSVSEILTADLRKKYHPCELCHGENLPEGAIVCLYSGVSNTYHRSSCSVVKKSYTSVSPAQARALGYTPCMLCCGEEDDYE